MHKKLFLALIAGLFLVVGGTAAALYVAHKGASQQSQGDNKVVTSTNSGSSHTSSGGQSTTTTESDDDKKDDTATTDGKTNSSKSTTSKTKSGTTSAGSSSGSSSSNTGGGTSGGSGGGGGATCPVTTLHMPDGPDGNGGCWPGPLTVGPHPAPTRTYPLYETGDRYVFDGGEVIDGYIINGSILVRGMNVVIKNSIINGGVEVYDTGSLTLSDSRISDGDWVGYTLTGANYTVIRSDTSGSGAVSICDGNCSFIDTYSHDPHLFTDWDAHQSTFATVGNNKGPLLLRHSTVWCNVGESPSGGGCTGDIALQNTFYPVVDTTIDNNLFMPTETGSYCGTFGWYDSSNIVVTNNVFRRGANGKCGVYGTSDAFRTDGPGNVWSGNVYEDGSVALPNS